MIDILFHLDQKGEKKSDSGTLQNHFKSIYADPVFTENKIGNVYALSVTSKTKTDFAKPLYSKKTNTYLWIIGTVFSTEQLLIETYEQSGINAFKDISGWFNILTYAEETRKIELINSRFGMDLINYYIGQDEVIITSRLSVFYQLKKNLPIDRAVVLQQSLYNYPFSNKTQLKDVYLLPSAHILLIENYKAKFRQYWSVKDDLVEKPLGFRKSVELLDQTLDSVIKRLVQKNDKIGVSLTGGWDGRLLLSYALKYIDKEKVTLYSFGAEGIPDVTIPQAISKKLGFNYYPIHLDNEYMKNKYLKYAANTVYFSDSLRSLKRAHYLYAMDFLSKKVSVILTGIAGSNLLKSTSYTPSNVFNKYVLNLIESDNREQELRKQLSYVHDTFGDLFASVTADDFIESFNLNDLNNILAIENPNERFCTYLISNIERNYFGAELASYKHLVSNYSPFLDYEFIKALLNTSFFGGYTDSNKYISTYNNTMLYAKLINRNNSELAAEPTDRGFSMAQMVNPLKYGSLMASYVKAKSRNRANTTSDYKTDDAVALFNDKFDLKLDELVKLEPVNKEFVSNYVSFSWYHRKMTT